MINRKNRTTMKLRKYLAVLAVAAFASLATSCAEAEDEFIHTDSTINSIEIQPAEGGAGIAGIIDETTGEIFFPIPKKLREKYDVKKLIERPLRSDRDQGSGRRQWIANLYAVRFLHAQLTNYNE